MRLAQTTDAFSVFFLPSPHDAHPSWCSSAPWRDQQQGELTACAGAASWTRLSAVPLVTAPLMLTLLPGEGAKRDSYGKCCAPLRRVFDLFAAGPTRGMSMLLSLAAVLSAQSFRYFVLGLECVLCPRWRMLAHSLVHSALIDQGWQHWPGGHARGGWVG